MSKISLIPSFLRTNKSSKPETTKPTIKYEGPKTDLADKARNMVGSMALASMILGGMNSCVQIDDEDYDLPQTEQVAPQQSVSCDTDDYKDTNLTFNPKYNKLSVDEKLAYTMNKLGLIKQDNIGGEVQMDYLQKNVDGSYDNQTLSIPFPEKASYKYENKAQCEQVWREVSGGKTRGTQEIRSLVLTGNGDKYPGGACSKIREEISTVKNANDGQGSLLITTVTNYDNGVLRGTPQKTTVTKLTPNHADGTFTEYEKDGDSWKEIATIKSNGQGEGFTKTYVNGETETMTEVRNGLGLPSPIVFSATVEDWNEAGTEVNM